jgi:hypothetical protein
MLARQYVGNWYIMLLHDESEVRETIRYTVEKLAVSNVGLLFNMCEVGGFWECEGL